MKKLILGVIISLILIHLYIASQNHPIETIKKANYLKQHCKKFGGYRGTKWRYDYGLIITSCKCNAIYCDEDYANFLEDN